MDKLAAVNVDVTEPPVAVDELPYHEVVNLFPAMVSDEGDSFEESIRASGIQVPVEWWRDEKDNAWIIDGRNRLERFKKLKAEGLTQTTSGKPFVCPCREFVGTKIQMLEHVLNLNRDKRQLNSGQRAAISVKAAYLQLKWTRKKDKGDLAEVTARLAGTNRTYVFDSQKLYLEAPDLLDSVASGALTLPQAKAKLAERKAAIAAPPEPAAEPADGEPTEQVTPPDTTPVIYDGLKNPVPTEFMHIFVLRDEFAAAVRELRKIKIKVDELKSGAGGDHLHKEEIVADLNHAIAHLQADMPHTICPVCLGKGTALGSKKKKCESCGGVKWVGKAVYKILTKKDDTADTQVEPHTEPVDDAAVGLGDGVPDDPTVVDEPAP